MPGRAEPARLRCPQVARVLATLAEPDAVADLAVYRHLQDCPRCREELTQYRALLRSLHTLRTDLAEPVPGVVGDVLAALGAAGERRVRRAAARGRRLAAVGAGFAAGVVVVAVVVVVVFRVRRGRRGGPRGGRPMGLLA